MRAPGAALAVDRVEARPSRLGTLGRDTPKRVRSRTAEQLAIVFHPRHVADVLVLAQDPLHVADPGLDEVHAKQPRGDLVFFRVAPSFDRGIYAVGPAYVLERETAAD